MLMVTSGSAVSGDASEFDRDGPVLGPADDRQLELAVRAGCIERLVEDVNSIQRAIPGRDDQITALDSRAVCRAAILAPPDQDTVALRKSDRPPEPTRDTRRGNRDAQLDALGSLAAP